MKAISIKDVAVFAGVSPTTVSRVLNDRGYISQETRDKVHAAIRELNYHPNQLARDFYRQQTNCIGVLVPDIRNPFWSEISYVIECTFHEHGYRVILCNTAKKTSRERAYWNMLLQNKVDGIIVGEDIAIIEECRKEKIPLVSIDATLDESIPCICADHDTGGKLAAEQLIKANCSNIIQFIGNVYSDINPAHRRHTVFSEIIKENGKRLRTCAVRRYGWDSQMQKRAVFDYLDVLYPFDGIFCVDSEAAFCIGWANEHNIKIPDELKIVGYDGTSLIQMLSPSLTSIRQPFNEIAETAVRILIEQIEVGIREFPAITSIPVELIKGNTT